MSASLINAATRMAKKHSGSAVNIGLNSYFAYDGYRMAREEGSGVASSVVSGAAEAAIPILIGPWAYIGMQLATGIPGAVVSGVESVSQYGRSLSKQSNQRPFQNSNFVETQGTYTMRQAGMALAQKSKYSLQQTLLGNEAQHMHR